MTFLLSSVIYHLLDLAIAHSRARPISPSASQYPVSPADPYRSALRLAFYALTALVNSVLHRTTRNLVLVKESYLLIDTTNSNISFVPCRNYTLSRRCRHLSNFCLYRVVNTSIIESEHLGIEWSHTPAYGDDMSSMTRQYNTLPIADVCRYLAN